MGRKMGELLIFGAVTFFDGYPIRGVFGEPVARLTLEYTDGSVTAIDLRHGLEIASASLLARCSRIDPRPAFAPRAAEIILDRDWERYAINLLRIAADGSNPLERVVIEALDDEFEPVIYGITVI